MSLIKKPTELEFPATLTAMIYGQPGAGKTTLALSAPSPVLFDFDGGVKRVNFAHRGLTLQVSKWEEVLEALEEVKSMPEVKTIVVDTCGKMVASIEDFIKRTMPRLAQNDGSLSLKGYGQRKIIFTEFNRSVMASGRSVVYVAHDVENRDGDNVVIRPEVGGKLVNEIIKELDLVGYLEVVGGKRVICFDPREKCYGKNTCNMPGLIQIPVVVDESGKATGENNFMATVVAAYQRRLNEEVKATAARDEVVKSISSVIAAADSADALNAALELVLGATHVLDSKTICGKLLNDKAKALGLTYDKKTKQYVSPEV